MTTRKINRSIPKHMLKMDRSSFFVINDKSKADMETYWLKQSVEDRFWAIEVLRMQFMEMNSIKPVMDRSYFEIRK